MTTAGAYVSPPAGSEVVAADGPGPFVTRVRYRLADGSLHEWTSRAHRKQGGRSLGTWIAVLFMVGSACFALASVAGYSSLVGARADAVTYFVGSIFFTSAAYLQYLECISTASEHGARRHLADAVLLARDPAHRLVGDGRAARRHAVLQRVDLLRPRLGAHRQAEQTSSSGRRMPSARSASSSRASSRTPRRVTTGSRGALATGAGRSQPSTCSARSSSASRRSPAGSCRRPATCWTPRSTPRARSGARSASWSARRSSCRRPGRSRPPGWLVIEPPGLAIT